MANFKEYTSSGGSSENFSIPTSKVEEIKVRIDGVLKTVTTDYTISNYSVSGGTVNWVGTPPNGPTVRIYRETNIHNNAETDIKGEATYAAGSSIKAGDLNKNTTQVLRKLEEIGSGDGLNDDVISTRNIIQNAVTTSKLAADSVNGNKIADDSIGAEHIEDLDDDVKWLDNSQAIFGTGSDLKIKHNSHQSAIENTTGLLNITNSDSTINLTANNDINLRPISGEEGVVVKGNGGVELYHNNVKKVETTSAGATVTGTLTADLADNSITTARIVDDAVTADKLADSINTEIAANTAKVTNATHTGDVTGSGELTIANSVVTEAKLADDAVTADKLANSINAEIAANTAKTTNATHTGDVTGSGELTIANNAVTTLKINNNAVTADKLATDSVTNLKVADDAIGVAELSATGTPDSTVFLRGDNTWSPASSSGTTYSAGAGLTLTGNEFSVDAIALTTVQTAANQTAMLALTTQEGDVVVRSDENKSYVKNSGTSGTMSDFTLLATPTDAVLSVDGNTGAITAAQIASAVESASDSNTFTDDDHSKLDGIDENANNYTHPTFDGDDIDVDTTALTGATVISDLDINITTDDRGHVTDANGSVSTRTLTLSDLGYTGASDANNYSISSDLLDEDDLSTNSATKVPSQQSVKAYVDASTGTTNLSNTANGTSLTVESSTGSNTSLPAATTSAWGVMTDEDKTNLDANTAKVTNATHTGDVTGSGELTIATDAVNGDKIANESIDSDHYVDLSIQTEHLANDAVDATKLADTTVSAGSYTAADITVDAQGRITAATNGTIADTELATNAVTNDKILDDTISEAKLDIHSAPSGTDKILGYTSNGMEWVSNSSYKESYISSLSPAFDGSTTDFTIANAPDNAEQILLSINGVIQKPNSGTSTPSEGFALSGSTVKLAAAPATGADSFVTILGTSTNNTRTQPNLIINGQFDVWQRPDSKDSGAGTTATAFYADRWQIKNGTYQFTRESFTEGQTDVPSYPQYFAKLDVTTGAAESEIRQRIEGVRSVQGTHTISFWAKGTNPGGGHLVVRGVQDFGTSGSTSVATDLGEFTLTTTWTKKTITFTPGSLSGKTIDNNSYYQIGFRQPSDDSSTNAWELNITNVQVEKGNTASDFERRQYNDELTKCLRYYQRFVAGAYGGIGLVGRKSGSNDVEFNLLLPHPMRGNPTGTWSNLAGLKLSRTYDSLGAVPTDVTVAGNNNLIGEGESKQCTSLSIWADTTSYNTGDVILQFATGSGNTQNMTLDAEL